MPSQSYEARGERILDAAAELVVRWGYKKTTIDDIAKQAGVAKGTIYLHWKTREELFSAMLVREELKLTEDMQQRNASDQEGATFHGMLKHVILATMKRPIWKAILLRDADVLGELAQTNYAAEATQKSIDNFRVYFDLLRSQELIRTDVTLSQAVYLVNAISAGFLVIDSLLPPEFRFSDEEAADMLADTIQRTFASKASNMANTQQALKQAFDQYIEGAVDWLKEQEHKEAES